MSEDTKIIKVNCNWCSKEIECPENMLTKKHMCYECFKKLGKEIKLKKAERVHIDIPTKELMGDIESF